jgi:hypothetical protein
VAERALHSPYAPFAAILDCVGGTELIHHLNHLVLDDPNAPELGTYLTIVGDSESIAKLSESSRWGYTGADSQKRVGMRWVDLSHT